MELRTRKKTIEPYDIWDGCSTKKESKIHPSSRRNKKNPLPHPGQSYNPDPEDHKKLLQKVLKKELAFKKKEANIRKAIEIKVNPKELLEDAREELVAGIEHLIKNNKQGENDKHLNDYDGSSTDGAYSDYDEKDFDAIVKDKTVKEKRKSKQQRLREMKDKLQRKAAKMRKTKNIRLSKFDLIKKLMKELDAKEKEKAKKNIKKTRKLRNERLGQKFEQSDPIYCLTTELPKNLREVSCPMDAIVREQLESFQSRLMVEPTSIQVKKRKYKKKEYERKVAAEQED